MHEDGSVFDGGGATTNSSSTSKRYARGQPQSGGTSGGISPRHLAEQSLPDFPAQTLPRIAGRRGLCGVQCRNCYVAADVQQCVYICSSF